MRKAWRFFLRLSFVWMGCVYASASGDPQSGVIVAFEIRLSDPRHWATLMIHTFANRETEQLFLSRAVGRFGTIERAARRKLLMIHAATRLGCLRVPPGNRLEVLRGARSGQYSIRINDQWRICFRWEEDGAYEVEIVDYH